MENTWGTPNDPHHPQPGRLAELTAFTLGSVALTISAVGSLVEHLGGPAPIDGAYAILGSVTVIGYGGWLVVWAVGQAEHRASATRDAALTGLRCQVTQLTIQVAALTRELRLHNRGGAGHVYQSATGTQDATVPLMPAVAPEAEAALRRINIRLLHGGEHN